MTRMRLLLTVLVMAGVAYGQRGGGAIGNGGQNRARSDMNSFGGGFVVHGAVELPDHVAPRRIVRLERLCGGKSEGVAFADAKGKFSFDLGVVSNQKETASQAPVNVVGKPAAAFADCVVRAKLEGFRAKELAIGELVKARQVDAPAIVLEPLSKDVSAILSATDAELAGEARKNYDAGLDLVALGKWKDAVKAVEKAAKADPKAATVWLGLGILQVEQKDAAGAAKSFTKAIEADEKFAAPYVELAVVEGDSENWAKVAEHSGKAIELGGDFSARAYYVNAMANVRLRKVDEALRSSTAGVKLDEAREFPDLLYINGMLLGAKGDKKQARARLEGYLEVAPNGDNAGNARELLGKL